MSDQQAAEFEVDVRALAKPEKHPRIFAAYDALPVGRSFVLVNDHDPRHLRDEFEADRPGSFGWEYVSRERLDWRIRITKITSTPLPRVLADTRTLTADTAEPDIAGAVWKLNMRDRDLDSNVVALPPNATIDSHVGPDLDVLVHVLAGVGQLATEAGTVDLEPGALVWLPRRSQRAFAAGPHGLRYLTVHQRRKALVLQTSAAA
jgi:uncharacterized protein (DUF2249 family)/quercetin dioxygenase-like cupin family protein